MPPEASGQIAETVPMCDNVPAERKTVLLAPQGTILFMLLV